MNLDKISEQAQRERNVEQLANFILSRSGGEPTDAQLVDVSAWSRAQSRTVAAVLVAVIGDVLGANLEFLSMAQVRERFGVVRNFLHTTRRPRGMYTDDGQSTLALLNALVDDGAQISSDFESHCVRRYTEAFTSLPRRGYGPTASAILDRLARGTTTPDKSGTLFFPMGSFANGCLMRIAALGAVASLRKLSAGDIDRAVRLAMRCTHASDEALAVCAAHVKLMVHLMAHEAPSSVAATRELVAAIASTVDNDFFRGKLAAFSEALPAALAVNEASTDDATLMAADRALLSAFVSDCEFGELFAIRAAEAFLVACYGLILAAKVGPEEALIRVVNWGGDADTIGCIAGSLIGAAFGAAFIPARWLTDLEDGRKIVALALELVRTCEVEPERNG